MTDLDHLNSAFRNARHSKDPRTQVGATIYAPKQRVVHAQNRIPFTTSLEKEQAIWDCPKAKGLCVQHAEVMAIHRWIEKYGSLPEGATMYATWACCTRCAEAIVTAGISRLVTSQATIDATPPRWIDEVCSGLEYLALNGVEVSMIDGSFEEFSDLMFGGRQWRTYLEGAGT